ncbi:hypothetical protein NB640_11865 [Oxalobacter vibrioformis]|uniref:Uncharacterized protein n=1 Tax=Oxalobacter vibrioformis TaxID=933080 RepID=A0A9E9P2H7_9BURK|nr:hypothetical protein [Oxalobacter vibrioformis]WAW09899.1 hypothetical protein NB640_11865 [Oxalobacter vibrioformis]
MPSEKVLLRFFLAVVLLLFAGSVFAQRYYSRSYRKMPRTELSAKSKKGIARILTGEDAASSGKTVKNGNTFNQAKADTERYRLAQEREMTYAFDERDEAGETPEYMVRAMQAYRVTGDRNVKRFAEAVSEFQEQALRERAMGYLENGDVENYNRTMAIISGKPYAPYSSIGGSGYVVNKGTGEISVGNPHTAGMYDRKVKADTARKNASAASQYARSKERAGKAASGTPKATRQKTAASGMTAAEYREARVRAIEASRPDLVKELDGMARHMGYSD